MTMTTAEILHIIPSTGGYHGNRIIAIEIFPTWMADVRLACIIVGLQRGKTSFCLPHAIRWTSRHYDEKKSFRIFPFWLIKYYRSFRSRLTVISSIPETFSLMFCICIIFQRQYQTRFSLYSFRNRNNASSYNLSKDKQNTSFGIYANWCIGADKNINITKRWCVSYP